jgi:hypothetical protein
MAGQDKGEVMKELTVELVDVMERLIEAVEKLTESGEERVAKITATVESEREAELLHRLEQAEAKIAELTASAAAAIGNAGRKTAMVAKHGAALEHVEASALDAALASLSVEQRIAVKAELLRSGAIA